MILAVSRTVAGWKVVSFGFLRIETREDGIYYVAQPQGRPPAGFKLTKSGKEFAVFENAAHDHPNVIAYRLNEAGGLVATIEGDEGGVDKKQAFRFERVKD